MVEKEINVVRILSLASCEEFNARFEVQVALVQLRRNGCLI